MRAHEAFFPEGWGRGLFQAAGEEERLGLDRIFIGSNSERV
jgi:hypothetical protein